MKWEPFWEERNDFKKEQFELKRVFNYIFYNTPKKSCFFNLFFKMRLKHIYCILRCQRFKEFDSRGCVRLHFAHSKSSSVETGFMGSFVLFHHSIRNIRKCKKCVFIHYLSLKLWKCLFAHSWYLNTCVEYRRIFCLTFFLIKTATFVFSERDRVLLTVSILVSLNKISDTFH